MNHVLYSLIEEYNLDHISGIGLVIGAKGTITIFLHQFGIMPTQNCSLIVLLCSE